MISRRHLIVLLSSAFALALPVAGAHAAPGGASPDALTLPGSPDVLVRIGNPLLNADANGISIAVRASALLRGRLRIDGTAPPTPSGVRIERLDASGAWIAVASAAVAADGSFHALWRPNRVGSIQLRAVTGDTPVDAPVDASGSSATVSAGTQIAAPQVGITVYRSGLASWYGGAEMAGTNTACGVVLAAGTLGVAHRTLPCGTPVVLYRRGRTLVVPVIDRGPYVRGRTWDLTRATFRALAGGSEGLLTLGALPLAVPPAPPAPVPAPG